MKLAWKLYIAGTGMLGLVPLLLGAPVVSLVVVGTSLLLAALAVAVEGG